MRSVGELGGELFDYSPRETVEALVEDDEAVLLELPERYTLKEDSEDYFRGVVYDFTGYDPEQNPWERTYDAAGASVTITAGRAFTGEDMLKLHHTNQETSTFFCGYNREEKEQWKFQETVDELRDMYEENGIRTRFNNAYPTRNSENR